MLCAYLINSIPVSDLDQYDEADLSGNPAIIVAASAPAGYQDISSIENWDLHGHGAKKDYKFIRYEIMVIAAVTGWANLTTEEKTLAAKYFAVGKTERDEIYTLDQQIDIGMLHHINSVESRNIRLAKVQMHLFNRLGKADIAIMSADVEGLTDHYLTEGVEGTLEGDGEGIFDYVDGTARSNHKWDGLGADIGLRDKTFVVEGFANCSLFADMLMDILKNGNY